MRSRSLLTAATMLVLVTGCSNLGTIGNVLGSVLGGMGGQQQQNQIEAQIEQVDLNSGRLYVRTRDGQQGTVRVDNQTMVVFNNQRYPVTSLERGDVVRIQIQQTRNNELYATRVDVIQSAR